MTVQTYFAPLKENVEARRGPPPLTARIYRASNWRDCPSGAEHPRGLAAQMIHTASYPTGSLET